MTFFCILMFIKECFMCGLDNGYRIYNTDPLKENAREGNNQNQNRSLQVFDLNKYNLKKMAAVYDTLKCYIAVIMLV